MLSRLQQIAALLALLLGIVVCSRAMAQDVGQAQRLVSREEGEAIALAALQHWPQVHDKPDCSHLVHQVYAEAGLDYEYAPTNDIYDGIDLFQRVQTPQPGDLVVWQGHVGIVIDAQDTSFYSSVISGFSVSSFTSTYWANRGPRRFYRYMISSLQSAHLQDLFGVRRSRSTIATSSASGEPKSITDRETSQSIGLDAERVEPRRGAGEALVKQARASETVPPATRASSVGVRRDRAAKDRPTKEAIRSAFVQLSESRAQELQQSGLPASPIEILDGFELGRVETQGLSGWAELKITKIASFANGKMRLSSATRSETVRFKLLRQAEGWTLVDSTNRIYLLRNAAISMITGRLAFLSKTPDSDEELRPLAKALEILLAGNRS